jgi:hypothetical protein
MAEKASLAKFKAIQKKLENAQKKVMKIREVADDKVAHMVRTTEVAAGAFAFGLAHGYANGDVASLADNVGGIPTPLAGALALHGLALFGIGGDMASHLHSFGDGALAAFASNFGRQIGAIKASNPSAKLGDVIKSAIKPGDQMTLTAGFDGVAGQRLSDAEIQALASK